MKGDSQQYTMSEPRILKVADAPLPCPTSVWHQDSYPSISPSRPELNLNGKNIFITGAGTGIGARTVLSFAEAGASNIGIFARRQNKLEEVKAEVLIKHPDIKIHIFTGDVSEQAEVEKALSEFAKIAEGQVNVLVSNAAISGPLAGGKIEEVDVSTWKEVMDTNLIGNFIVMQSFLRHAAPGAVLINVTSAASFILFGPGLSAYSVSKAATVALYRYLQFERPDLRAVSIQPGGVSTEMSKKSGPMVDDGKLISDSMELRTNLL